MYKLKTEVINGIEKIVNRPKKEDARQKEYLVIDSNGKEVIKDKNWVRENIEKIENVGLSGTSLYILNPKSNLKKRTILDYIEEAKKKGQKSLTLNNITVDTGTLEILSENKSKLDTGNSMKNSNNSDDSYSVADMKKAIRANLANSSFVCKLSDTRAVVKSNTKDYGVFDVKENKYLKIVNALSIGGDDSKFFDFNVVATYENRIAFFYELSDGHESNAVVGTIWYYKHCVSVYEIDASLKSAVEIYRDTLQRKTVRISEEESMALFFNRDLLFVDMNSSSYDRTNTLIIDLRTHTKHKNISAFRPNIEKQTDNYIVIPNSIQIKENNGNIEIKYNQERHMTGYDAKLNLDKSLKSIEQYIYDYECWQKSADNMYSSIICYADGRPPKSGNYYSGEKPTNPWVTYRDRYLQIIGEGQDKKTVVIERTRAKNGKWKEIKTVANGSYKTLESFYKR